MKIDYRGSSKILKRLAELVNRSQNIALRQDTTDKNVLYWTDLDGVEITINIPSGSVEVDAELSETSTNPAENQAITKELAKKADKSEIPAVGDGVLSVQRNGKSVGTFSANAAEDASVNISVPEKVSELENDAGYGTYTNPATGIPKSDLASSVQTSLGKADTALQKHQDISGKLDKTGDASNTTVTFTAASARENVKTGEKLSVLFGKIAKWFGDLKAVAFTGSYKDLSDKPTIPDISGKQDKTTAVTHTANTAVGSATKPVYIAANGAATPISHSINADVPANAKFTDTTYSDATQSAHGLMTAADKKKLDGMDLTKYLPLSGGVMTGDIDMKANKRDILVGTHKANTSSGTPIACGTIDTDKKFDEMLPTMRSYIGTYRYKTSSAEAWYDVISVRHRNGHSDGSNWGMYIYAKLFGGNLQWNLNTNKDAWQGERTLLDSVNYTSYAAKSSHTHEMIVNNSKLIAGSNNAAQWCRLGTLTSFENFSTAVISVWSGDGANGNASQNSWFEIHIKDGWQSTQSTTKACGVTVYRAHCDKVKVKVIPTAHNTFTVWVYLPWAYWNGNYAVNGRYKTWTTDFTHQTAEPEGTGANTAYYDQAFLTSTVAKSTEATTLTETAWTDVPETNISPRYGKNIKYLKSGNTVYVRGSISFSQSLNNPCCGTMPSDLLPDDYQDHVFTAWNLLGGVPTAYPVVLAKDGKITLMNPTSKAQWFEAGRAYNFNFNYHIG